MIKRTVVAGFVLLALVAVTPRIRADEGRIPIYTATTITQPGSYIVTRDITSTVSPPVTIQASPVTLDLNGMFLDAGYCDAAGVLIAAGASDVTILNGSILNGRIHSSESAPISLTIKSISIRSTQGSCGTVGVLVSSCKTFEIDSMRLDTGYISITPDPAGGPMRGRFTNNTIVNATIGISINMSDSLVKRNVINSGSGLSLSIAGDRNLIEDNHVSGGDYGIKLTSGEGNTVRGNQVKALLGIRVSAQNNLIADNVVTGYGGSTGLGVDGTNNRIDGNVVTDYATGISVSGTNNRIEGNVTLGNDALRVIGDSNSILNNELSSNGVSGWAVEVNGSMNRFESNSIGGGYQYGLNFASGSGNFYRNNVLIGNGVGGVTGDVGSQIDGGGNVP